MMQKPCLRYGILGVLLILLLMSAACKDRGAEGGIGTEPTPVPTPAPDPSPEPSDPEAVAFAYLRYWQQGDFDRAYALLSSISQLTISEADYRTRHENIYSGIGLETIEIGVAEFLTDVNTADLRLKVQYHTTTVDTIDLEIQMSMNLENGAWRVQWQPNMIFPKMRRGDRIRVFSLAAEGGEVFDARGVPLAKNDRTQAVVANPEKIEADFVKRIAPILGMTEAQVQKALEGRAESDGRIILRHLMPGRLTDDLKNRILGVPGAGIFSTHGRDVRLYPQGNLLTHVLADMDVYLEKELAGTPGYEISIFSEQNEKRSIVALKPPQRGPDLVLTVDLALQRRTESLLREHLGPEQRGAVVVLDPTTGEIQAMASYPDYDLNELRMGVTQARMDELKDPKAGQPFLNRALAGRYPPGSTVKPFTAAMALAEGLADEHWVFPWTISDNRWIPVGMDWPHPPIRRYSGYGGPINLMNAMTHSDNIVYAYLALQAGEETFIRHFRAHGFLEPIPLELPVGKGQLSRDGTLSSPRLLADTAYGQGEILVTPLSMAVLFSAFANEGDIMQPFLIRERRAPLPEVTAARVWRQQAVDVRQVAQILPSLVEVVERGTGRRVRIPGTTVAGKTGTAELDDTKTRVIAWFIGFTVNTEAPRLVCVMLDVPSGEGDARYPIAAALLE